MSIRKTGGGARELGIRADLHLHTLVSDGKPTPQEVVLEAEARGLNVIAVTDHDTFEGSYRAQRFARQRNAEVLVLIGAEIRTEQGDVLVLCGRNGISRVPRRIGELIDVAHAEGCLVVPAHPFDVRRYGIGRKLYQYRWDAIEVFNAASDPLSNELARKAAIELGLPGIASSDAHVLEAIGSAYTVIEVDTIEDVDDILEAIAKGNVRPVAGRPSLKTLVKAFAWSIERRLGLYDRRRLAKIEEMEADNASYNG
jgi:predicted metal-dependent phosphoesterase TrpH